MADTPNVVVVLTDQLRADAMGCAGNDDVHTPNLDRFSTEGTRFSNAYTNNPICTPSRACLLSGQHSVTNTVVSNDLPLPTDAPGLGSGFKAAGYRTGYIGKWHLDGVPRDKWTPPGARRQGFDDFWAVYNCAHDYFNPRYYRDTPDLIEREGYEPIVQTDLAVEFLDETTEDPFCLMLSWGPPHAPYELVPERYRERYEPERLAMPPNAEPLVPTDSETRGPPIRHWGTADEFATGEPYAYDDPREILADYYAAVTALDDQFGRVLDELDARGLTEDTIVVFMSDHGDNLWAHGHNQKGLPYEESVNVPFVIRWPDEVPAGRTNDTLLSTVDIAPTLLSAAGVTIPDAMEGTVLTHAIRGEHDATIDSVYMMGGNWRAVRTSRYTFARFVDGLPGHEHLPKGDWLLFDNERDPHQCRNRLYDREYAETRERLATELEGWIEALEDPFVPMADLVRELGIVEEWNAQVEWFERVHEGYDHEIGTVPRRTEDGV